MATVLRPRFDCTIVLADGTHEVVTTLRDMVTLKAQAKGRQITGDGEDVVRLAHLACIRLGLFAGTFDEFVDATEDFEAREPLPLGGEASSSDSSPP